MNPRFLMALRMAHALGQLLSSLFWKSLVASMWTPLPSPSVFSRIAKTSPIAGAAALGSKASLMACSTVEADATILFVPSSMTLAVMCFTDMKSLNKYLFSPISLPSKQSGPSCCHLPILHYFVLLVTYGLKPIFIWAFIFFAAQLQSNMLLPPIFLSISIHQIYTFFFGRTLNIYLKPCRSHVIDLCAQLIVGLFFS